MQPLAQALHTVAPPPCRAAGTPQSSTPKPRCSPSLRRLQVPTIRVQCPLRAACTADCGHDQAHLQLWATLSRLTTVQMLARDESLPFIGVIDKASGVTGSDAVFNTQQALPHERSPGLRLATATAPPSTPQIWMDAKTPAAADGSYPAAAFWLELWWCYRPEDLPSKIGGKVGVQPSC